MFAVLVWIAHAFGLMRPGTVLVAMLMIAACIVGFFLFIRSGWNESLPDPSLTLPMILASSTVNTYVLQALLSSRGAFMMIYLVSMMFGVFRLNRRQLLAIAGFIIASYALVIWRLRSEAPDTTDLAAEYTQWVVLTCVLIWFALMGGYIGALINRLGQAEFDELTGAYTRRRILEILRHEKLRADRSVGALSLCLLDIDQLKRVNDTLGHQGGDRHLKRVATAVQQELRTIDYLGRYGGDEFLVVLSETPLRGALECAERIQRTLYQLNGEDAPGQLAATVSIGIAQYIPGENLTQTVGRADRALYAAKNGGRNRTEWAPVQE